MDKMKEMTGKVKNGWNQLDRKKQIAMIVVIASVLLFVSIYTIVSKKVDYVVLYKDLSLEDAGKIVEDLDSKQIKYKLGDGGTTIFIDSKNMDKYRLELATDGNLPSDSAGFELFDDMGMMLTDDDRKIMYQRALEGELERSISSLDAIKKAKVHLVMSQKSIFEVEEKEASASVILDIKPNKRMSTDSLRGIASLVSGAVENLPLGNIKIVDSNGNLLSSVLDDYDENNSLGMLSKYQDIRLAYERQLERNVIKILTPLLGMDKFSVVVNADLDFDSTESEIVIYSDPVTRSEQLNVTGNDLETHPDDGVLGSTASNVIKEVKGEDASYSRTINNELTTEKSTIVTAPGKVNKLTASVVYDGNLSARNKSEIEELVGSAIGYDLNRNDSVNIMAMKFDKDGNEIVKDQVADTSKTEKVVNLIKNNKPWAIAIGAVLALLIIILIIKARIRRAEEEEMALEEDLEDEESGEPLKNEVKTVEELEMAIDVTEETVKDYTEKHPDLAADMIKVWMKDK